MRYLSMSRGKADIPAFAAGIEDGTAGVKDAVGEMVLAEVLPDVPDRVQLWRIRRQGQEADGVGHEEVAARSMPARAVGRDVGRDDGMGAGSCLGADLGQVPGSLPRC